MRKFFKTLITLLILAGIGFGGWKGWQYWKHAESLKLAKSQKSPDKLFVVKRGDLAIGVMLSGSVDTKVRHKLSLDVPISTKVVSIVDENTKVNKGDIVARFETESLQEKIDELKVSIADAQKALDLANEELAILISTNDADIKTARDNLDDAISAYSKLHKLEGPKDKNSQNQTVADSMKSLKDAQTTYKTAYDNYFNPTDVAKDESENETRKKTYENALKALKSARISYRNTLLSRKIFKRYTRPNTYKNARDKVTRMELTLKKEIVRTQSSLAQKKASVANAEVNLHKKERDLEQQLYYMTNMQLVAPVNGFVTYGDPDRNRWGKTEVKVGMETYRRQVLVTIPDMSVMVINLDIPEQYRSKVHVGADVIITPDSVQNLKINGVLSSISALPILLIPWDPKSAKAYKSIVEFTAKDARIVSGINVRTEIISQVLKDVIYVPLEAIFERGGNFFVYRDAAGNPEEVNVTIGLSNDNYVEVKEGLNVDDVVYLYRPFQNTKAE